MKEIIEQASRLGKSIAGSPQAEKLRQIREELQKEKDLDETLKAYHKHIEKISALERENKPVEVDDKHKLQDMHDKLVASEIFKKYTSAQMDYIDLMRKVSEAMRAPLAKIEKE